MSVLTADHGIALRPPGAALPRSGRIVVERVTTAVPRAGSKTVEPAAELRAGAAPAGQIALRDRVVAKIASRAAGEIDGVGSAARRLLGVPVSAPGLEVLGAPSTSLRGLPSASADVDGRRAFITVTLSVAYPLPLRHTAALVRDRVRAQVATLTGLQVVEVDIQVSALVVERDAPARVR